MQGDKQDLPLVVHAVLQTYSNGPVANEQMYEYVDAQLDNKSPKIALVGQKKTPRNINHRAYRWAQQTLKTKGLIERHDRGVWQATTEGKFELTKTVMDNHMIAASTSLGVIIWGDARKIFKDVICDDIHLCLTSIPYFSVDRSYGTKTIKGDREFIEIEKQRHIRFLLDVLGPICDKMVPGASLAINIPSNTVIPNAHGERSDFVEDFTLAIRKELRMVLADRLVWYAKDKQPRGYATTHQRTHLASKYELVLWFTNNASVLLADNRRVLVPYNKQMASSIANGGNKKDRAAADYNTTRKGSFSRDNGGSIPGNVLEFATNCARNRKTIRQSRLMGLPPHGAVYPYELADFLVKWLCPPGGVVVDPFAGTLNTPHAAESNGMFWYASELHWEYIKPSLIHFEQCNGYYINPLFESVRHC